MKLVHLQWIDSCSPANSGWKSVDDRTSESEKPILCESIGWVLFEDAGSITIAGHISHGAASGDINEASGEMTIPKVALVKRRKVKI